MVNMESVHQYGERLKGGEDVNISTKQIEILLAERKMNMTELANTSGISRQSISTIVRRGTCKPCTVGKLAGGLGVRIEDIIQEQGDNHVSHAKT